MKKLNQYTSYKKSNDNWIGDIPSHWSVFRFKHIFKISKIIVGETGYDVLSITQRGIKVKDIKSGAGQLSMDYSKYQKVDIGDFAMNHMDLLTGFVDLSKFDGVVSPDYRVFKLKHEECNKEFLLYILQLGYSLRIFFKFGKGVSMLGRWRLPAENFKNLILPIPPLSEQVSINNFLNYKLEKINRFISKKKQLIRLLNEKKVSIINQAVTKGLNLNSEMIPIDNYWVDGIPKTFKLESFSKNVYLKHGFQFREEHFSNEGIKIVKISQLSPDGYLDLRKASFIPKNLLEKFTNIIIEDGDILMALTGGTIGKIIRADIKDEVLLQNYRVGNFYPSNKKLTKEFLYWILKSEFIQAQMNFYVRETGQPNIGKGDFNKILLIIPTIEAQKEITKYIEVETQTIDKLISTIEKEMTLVEEYKTTLIVEAVTGKIDVRDFIDTNNEKENLAIYG